MATKSKSATKKKSNLKSVKGSGGLKSRKFNWKTMILLILPIALIGGFFVYKSNAATGTIWNVKTHNPNPISNYGGTFPKADGSKGWEGGAGNWIKIHAVFTTANINNKTYCAEGNYIGTDYAVAAGVAFSNAGRPATISTANTGSSTYRVCTTAHSATQVGDWIDLYVCGRSGETASNQNKCTTGKVTGRIQVQNFYRP